MAVQWIVTPEGAIMPQVSGQLPQIYQDPRMQLPAKLGQGFTLGLGTEPQYTGTPRPGAPAPIQIGGGNAPLQLGYSPNSAPVSPSEKIMTGVAGQHPGYARASQAAKAAPKSMLGQTLGALGTGASVLGKGARALASVPGAIGSGLVLTGLGEQANNQGNIIPADASPEIATALRRAGWEGGPPVSPARETWDRLVGIAPMATVGVNKAVKSGAEAVGKFFTPRDPNMKNQPKQEPLDTLGAYLQSGNFSEAGGAKSNSIPLGQNPLFEIGAPPQRGAPGEVDMTEAKAWMEKAKPKTVDEEEQGKSRQLSSIMGLLSGALSIGPNDGVGDILLKVGAGLVGGYAKGKEKSADDAKEYEAANRSYAAAMAGNSLDMAKLSASHQEKMSEIAFQNATSAQSFALLKAQAGAPKMLGISDGIVSMQVTDPQTGQMSIQSTQIASRDTNKAAVARLVSNGVPYKEAVLMANTAHPARSPFEFAQNVASEVLTTGMGSAVVGEKAWEELQAKAAQSMAMVPGTDTQKNRAYQEYLRNEFTVMFNNNPDLFGRVVAVSPSAQGFVAFKKKLGDAGVSTPQQLGTLLNAMQNQAPQSTMLSLPPAYVQDFSQGINLGMSQDETTVPLPE